MRQLLLFLSFVAFFVLVSACGEIAGNPNLRQSTVELHWTPPIQNTDGSKLEDLEGYIIYYGNQSGLYQFSYVVWNQTSCTISGLSLGSTYYFAVTAFDTYGNISNPSNEVEAFIEVN